MTFKSDDAEEALNYIGCADDFELSTELPGNLGCDRVDEIYTTPSVFRSSYCLVLVTSCLAGVSLLKDQLFPHLAQHAPTTKVKLMKGPLLLLKTELGMIPKLWATLMLGFVVGQPIAFASVITQTFESSWSVDVWDYNGDLAAME